MPDDKADTTKFDLDMTGLAAAWTLLKSSCALSTLSPISPWPATLPNVGITPPAAPAP
ncbi:hypothetical protein [Bradyrhizobium betae]|uniref:hypothetical protein n=1 Tax=Bradyrhizobium betae TaxID=244734 RepID=UPI001FE1FA15|nr:hypothetical protein [Bradyrhizobium betae]